MTHEKHFELLYVGKFVGDDEDAMHTFAYDVSTRLQGAMHRPDTTVADRSGAMGHLSSLVGEKQSERAEAIRTLLCDERYRWLTPFAHAMEKNDFFFRNHSDAFQSMMQSMGKVEQVLKYMKSLQGRLKKAEPQAPTTTPTAELIAYAHLRCNPEKGSPERLCAEVRGAIGETMNLFATPPSISHQILETSNDHDLIAQHGAAIASMYYPKLAPLIQKLSGTKPECTQEEMKECLALTDQTLAYLEEMKKRLKVMCFIRQSNEVQPIDYFESLPVLMAQLEGHIGYLQQAVAYLKEEPGSSKRRKKGKKE